MNSKNKKIYQIIIGLLVSLALVAPSASWAKGQSLRLADSFSPLTYLSDLADQNKLDADRAKRLDDYFEKRDMPLAGYGSKFVEVAEKCGLDWRLLPAISVRESSGGKHLMNKNPFGWGSAKIKFYNFEDAIETVSDNLCGFNLATAKYYKNKTILQQLWYYNGSVMPSYPQEVLDIMEMM